MNTSINYSGFLDMYTNSDDDYEPYGFGDTTDSLERVYQSIESYKAGFQDREYNFDE